jgi:hypothetical protein
METKGWPPKSGRKVMEWFSQKTSIAGLQISNWMIVLKLVRLSRTSIADEMRIEHRRRIFGE